MEIDRRLTILFDLFVFIPMLVKIEVYIVYHDTSN